MPGARFGRILLIVIALIVALSLVLSTFMTPIAY